MRNVIKAAILSEIPYVGFAASELAGVMIASKMQTGYKTSTPTKVRVYKDRNRR
ncbi:hypothetical protein AB1K18_20930 [Peribacillus simplex]|uniref:hypothetical protein n=1 Tax=Peribacillus simplex TaxID=1478 RepID=UPI003B8D030F